MATDDDDTTADALPIDVTTVRDEDGNERVKIDVTALVAATMHEFVDPVFALLLRLRREGRVTVEEIAQLREEIRAVGTSLAERLAARFPG